MLCSGCRASDVLTAGGPGRFRTQGCGRGRAWLSRRGRGGASLRPSLLPPITISRLRLVGRRRGGANSARPGGIAILAAIPHPRATHVSGLVLQKREGNLCRLGVVAALVGWSSGALARLARRRPIRSTAPFPPRHRVTFSKRFRPSQVGNTGHHRRAVQRRGRGGAWVSRHGWGDKVG